MGCLGQNLKILLLGISIFAAVCCTKKDGPKNQGTQDTGGGSAQYSTPDQVRGALDRALKLATDIDQQKNVFAQFWIDWGRKSKNDFIKKPIHLFPDMGEVSHSMNLRGAEFTTRFKSPFLEALIRNRFDRKEKGDCLTTSSGEHKDASVSALNINADICFSIGNLTRVPPSSLLREVLSLLLHEATHLAGAEEAEAKVWQTEFSTYFGSRFGDLTADTATAETLKALSSAKILLARAQSFAEADAKNPRILASTVFTIPRITSSSTFTPAKKAYNLEVHHMPPWEFADIVKKLGKDGAIEWHRKPENMKFLVSLCTECHDLFHQKEDKKDSQETA